MSDAGTQALTSTLATRTGTDPSDWYLVFKARYGMTVVFRALRALRGPGDVVTQVFTCSTAVDPILVAGLAPVYGEVSRASVALDPDRLVLSERTRAVVVQHTFGIVDEEAAARLRSAAHAAGALLVEDSAHCAGRLARDASGEPVADVSVHSFGVEKALPTFFGGAVWVNPRSGDEALRESLAGRLAALPPAGPRLDLLARVYRAQIGVLNRLPPPVAGPVRRALTAARAFEPAVAPAEQRGALPYRPMRPSAWMTRQVLAALPHLDESQRRRAAAVAVYQEALTGSVEIPSSITPGDGLVRWPCFAADRAGALRILAALRAAGVYAGSWYRPALFPGVEDPAVYGYTPGDAALATSEDLVDRVVNLPTAVDPDEARRIARIVATAAAGA